MEGSKKKRWPLGLIKRGERMTGPRGVIVWQEPEIFAPGMDVAITTIEAAMSVGYEAHYFVPIGYSEKLVEAAEELLACLPGESRIEYADTEHAVEQLELVIQSYRDNVASQEEVVNG